MTDTTTMTRATHNATAATAIRGMNLLVKYRTVSLLWYTDCASYSFHASSVLSLEHFGSTNMHALNTFRDCQIEKNRVLPTVFVITNMTNSDLQRGG